MPVISDRCQPAGAIRRIEKPHSNLTRLEPDLKEVIQL